MSTQSSTEPTRLLAENAELRARLEEAEDALHAIRDGEVDALVIATAAGPQVFTLQGLDAESNRLRGEMLAQVGDAVIAVDDDQRVTFINAAAATLYGITMSQALGSPLAEVFTTLWPNPADEATAACELEQTGHWRGESRHVKRSGETIAVESSVRRLQAQNGTPPGQLAVIRDITKRKRAEESLLESRQRLEISVHEKEVLLKEVHHRVKNNMQIIDSLLRLQANAIENPAAKTAMLNMQCRIRSMGLIHESLYRSDNLAAVDIAAYLNSLCSQLMRALVSTPGAIQLRLDLAPVHLAIDKAIPCGLLVNELVSNALKHAFPDGRSGVLRVDLQPLAHATGWRLRVSDDGVGLPPDFDLRRTTSLGLKLVTDLAHQLGGKLKISSGPEAVFEIEVREVNGFHV